MFMNRRTYTRAAFKVIVTTYMYNIGETVTYRKHIQVTVSKAEIRWGKMAE